MSTKTQHPSSKAEPKSNKLDEEEVDDVNDLSDEDGAPNDNLRSYYISRISEDETVQKQLNEAKELEVRERAKNKVLKKEVVRLRKLYTESLSKIESLEKQIRENDVQHNVKLRKTADEKNHISNLMSDQNQQLQVVMDENVQLRRKIEHFQMERQLIQNCVEEYANRTSFDRELPISTTKEPLHEQIVNLISILANKLEDLQESYALVNQDRALMANQIKGYEAGIRAYHEAEQDERTDRLKALAMLSRQDSHGELVDMPLNEVDHNTLEQYAATDEQKANVPRGKEMVPVQDEMYENQRKLPLVGWKAPSLPTDRKRFSSEDGTQGFASLESLPLPADWRWTGNWSVSMHGNVDNEGWEYAKDFRMFEWHGEKKMLDFVRRRKWVRSRERIPLPQVYGSSGYQEDPYALDCGDDDY